MKVFGSLTVVLVALTAACGGGDDGGSSGGVTIVDAQTGSGSSAADAASAACTLGAISSATPTTQEAYYQTADGETAPGRYYLFADLNQDAAPDVLYVDLFDGYTAFEGGLAPATIDLSDTAEQTYDTCGGCVIVQTDYSDSGATDEYMPTGGTLSITSVSTTSVAGTLTNASFRHVTIADDGTTTTAADGCTGSVGNVSFSAVPTADTAFAAGGTKTRWRMSLHAKTLR